MYRFDISMSVSSVEGITDNAINQEISLKSKSPGSNMRQKKEKP